MDIKDLIGFDNATVQALHDENRASSLRVEAIAPGLLSDVTAVEFVNSARQYQELTKTFATDLVAMARHHIEPLEDLQKYTVTEALSHYRDMGTKLAEPAVIDRVLEGFRSSTINAQVRSVTEAFSRYRDMAANVTQPAFMDPSLQAYRSSTTDAISSLNTALSQQVLALRQSTLVDAMRMLESLSERWRELPDSEDDDWDVAAEDVHQLASELTDAPPAENLEELIRRIAAATVATMAPSVAERFFQAVLIPFLISCLAGVAVEKLSSMAKTPTVHPQPAPQLAGSAVVHCHGQHLHVRSTFAADGAVVGDLPDGATVTVETWREGWAFIDFTNGSARLQGWVAGAFLKIQH